VDLLIKRDEIHETRIDESAPRALAAGEALLAIESFGLTANNITYAVMGEAMGYWEFFPSGSPGWGLLPAWGFASVVDPGDTGLTAGMRVFGYVPASSHLVVSPSRAGDRGFVDAALHRATLPSAYQRYRAVGADPAYAADREDEQMLFWPLFYTSWLIDDFLGDLQAGVVRRPNESDPAATDADAVGAHVEVGGVLVRKHHSLLSIEEDDGDRTAIEEFVQRLDHRQHRRLKRHACTLAANGSASGRLPSSTNTLR
jgi:hypothetical protein